MSQAWHNFVPQSKWLLWMATRIIPFNLKIMMRKNKQPEGGGEQLSEHDMLKTILFSVNEIHKVVSDIKEERDKIKREREALASSIHIDQKLMQKIFKVSMRTLQRWRDEKRVQYHLTCNGAYCYYLFDEVEVAIMRGTISAKYSTQTEALERLHMFRDGIIQGKSIEDIYGEFE